MMKRIICSAIVSAALVFPGVGYSGGSGGAGAVSWGGGQTASVADSGFNFSSIVDGFLDFFRSEPAVDATSVLLEWAATSAFEKSMSRVLSKGISFYTTAEETADIVVALYDLSNVLRARNRTIVSTYFDVDMSPSQIADAILGEQQISYTGLSYHQGLVNQGMSINQANKAYIETLVVAYAQENGY